MSAIIQDNALVHYEVLGRGKPVLFLHSWVGSWRYWVRSMEFTSTRHRTYALDFWGFGASRKLPSRYTLENQVSLVHDFILHMGIDHFTLVGHGLGAIIANYYAADYSEHVERLMVISFPMGNQNANPRLITLSPIEAAEWLFGRTPENKASRIDATKADPQAIQISIGQFEQVNWRQLISRVPVSTLWIQGQHDQAIHSPSGEQLTNLPDLADFLFFSDSGHFPMLDEPNKFHRLLLEFLKLEPGRDPKELSVKPMWKRRVR